MKDVFLSHASVDKERYVRPFAAELKRHGVTYWLDKTEIRWSDDFAKRINDGLKDARYFVIFLTQQFVGRPWPETELFVAIRRYISDRASRIFPILVGNPLDLLEAYPLLEGIEYRLWNRGPRVLARELAAVIKSETQEIERAAEGLLRQYHIFVTERAFAKAYGCFSKGFRKTTSAGAYKKVFKKTLEARLLEYRLLNTIGNKAFCHIAVAAAGADKQVEIWKGTVELIRENGRWKILTTKGLKHYE